ncbi:hypothetical protein AB283_09300 [Lactobacillus amylovorus]|nr:hypothetical protein AB283_09300 [Lactobacillus amylovorus]
MKKFVLNLISVLTWIYQAFCVLSIVMSVAMTGFMIFIISQPDIRAEVEKELQPARDISLNNNTIWWLLFGLFEFMFVGFFAQFFICHYARSIVKNIKQDVYFAIDNLKLLKKLLISVAVYVVVSIIYYVMAFCNYATLTAMSKHSSNTASSMFYSSGVAGGLLFLAVIYVVYLVFKYGMKVQEDADSII